MDRVAPQGLSRLTAGPSPRSSREATVAVHRAWFPLTPQRLCHTIEHMFEQVSGPDLGPALAAVELAGLDGEGLVEALAATQRLVSWVQARQADVVAEIDRRGPQVIGPAGCTGYEVAEFEVGAALRLSSRAASGRVDGCLAVAGRPAVLEALRDGRLDWVRAVSIAESVDDLASRPGMARAADDVEAQALDRAAGQTAPQVRAALARLVLKADPAGADARLAAARRERRVWVNPQEDGMAELRALLAAPDAQRVYAALGEAGWAARCAERDAQRDAAGRAAEHGEPPLDFGPLPTLDQCRADALVEILCGTGGRGAGPAGAGVASRPGGARPPAAPTGTGPAPRGQRPQILVTVPAGTLLGLGGEPAHLAGYGPIPDALARELAQEGTWRRVLTDPATGAVLDVGRRQHDPPADLERFVRIRDGMCRFPGCRRQAAGCDLDHAVPYPQGRQAPRTCTRCAAGTTGSSTRPGGRSTPNRATGWSGPAPSERPTPPTRPAPATSRGPDPEQRPTSGAPISPAPSMTICATGSTTTDARCWTRTCSAGLMSWSPGTSERGWPADCLGPAADLAFPDGAGRDQLADRGGDHDRDAVGDLALEVGDEVLDRRKASRVWTRTKTSLELKSTPWIVAFGMAEIHSSAVAWTRPVQTDTK